MLLTSTLVNAMVAASGVSAAAISSRDYQTRWIGHSEVHSFPETVPNNLRGRLYLKHKPFLKVFHGCVPFPAVDDKGQVGSGLKTTGAHNGKCSKSTGQVYARGAQHDGKFAIMYSWYMPKDSVVAGSGHRHEWEDVVVWLSEESESAKFLGTAYSAHGKYSSDHSVPDGGRPLVGYCMDGSTHSTCNKGIKGGEQPLIAYENLPPVAAEALDKTSFEDAVVPFKNTDGRFNSQLDAAKLGSDTPNPIDKGNL